MHDTSRSASPQSPTYRICCLHQCTSLLSSPLTTADTAGAHDFGPIDPILFLVVTVEFVIHLDTFDAFLQLFVSLSLFLLAFIIYQCWLEDNFGVHCEITCLFLRVRASRLV